MAENHNSQTLSGMVVDCHNHAGVSLNAYSRMEYPYAATVEGIYYRQKACGVDVSIVFPFTPDLYFELSGFAEHRMIPARVSPSPAPYAVENELSLREVYDYCPELSGRFLPFLCASPTRDVAGQVRNLEALSDKYPVYGIKVSGVLGQSPLTAFFDEGRELMELFRERGWPVLLHTSYAMSDIYSNYQLALELAEGFPETRFCLAHCIGFYKAALDRAAQLPNVWVDTSAMAIQVEAARAGHELAAPPGKRFEADYSSPGAVIQALAEAYPGKIMWGSDTPAYSYICRRRHGDSAVAEFRLKARYEDEVAALRYLPPDLQREVSNHNTLDFLFGRGPRDR